MSVKSCIRREAEVDHEVVQAKKQIYFSRITAIEVTNEIQHRSTQSSQPITEWR